MLKDIHYPMSTFESLKLTILQIDDWHPVLVSEKSTVFDLQRELAAESFEF